MPSTCVPGRNIEKVPESVAERLSQICDADSMFKIRGKKYQQHLIA